MPFCIVTQCDTCHRGRNAVSRVVKRIKFDLRSHEFKFNDKSWTKNTIDWERKTFQRFSVASYRVTVESLLGSLQQFLFFIKSFPYVVIPLENHTSRRNITQDWDESCMICYKNLKDILGNAAKMREER